MVSFPQLESWIRAGDIDSVVTGLLSLDEASRRALAAQVKSVQLHWSDPEADSLSVDPDAVPGLMHTYSAHLRRVLRREGAWLVAGAACLPRAADVVSWVRSDRFWRPPMPQAIDAVALVLRAPGRPSLPAIARSLAEKMRPTQVDNQWALIERLLAEAELPPPVTEAALRGWMRRIGADRHHKDLAELLRADPHLEHMLPHVFTVPLLGQELDDEWTRALARLAADGVLDRQALLDGCVLRLRAGDRTAALRRMVVLHRLLDPSAEEAAARRAEYCGMLSAPDSAVADAALRALRLADDAGLLDADAVAEAAWALLLRKEKKLVRAQLDWLAAALARKPEPVLFEALLSGLANPAADLAERVLKLAAAHLSSFGETGHEQLTTATADLQGDLRRQATALLARADPGSAAPTAGIATPPPSGPAASPVAGSPAAGFVGSPVAGSPAAGFVGSPVAGIVVLPAVVPAAPMPPPIASIPELVAEAKHLLYQAEDPIRVELILDALVRFTAADRPALARALEPIVPAWRNPFSGLLHAVVSREFVAWAPSAWERTAGPPFWMPVKRMAELARQMCQTPPPALLATPATVDGHVDPARVLRLLGEDWEPEPFDLSQALLRLPREVAPDIRASAARLESPAGKAFADFLAGGGLPDPDVVAITPVRPCPHVVKAGCNCRERPRRRTVAFEPIKHNLTVQPYLLYQPAEFARDRVDGHQLGRSIAGWPMILPSHREIAAAHIQPRLIEAAESRSGAAEMAVLPALAACDGPFGPAMALCLAYGLTATRPESRLAASDAFVDLAARGVLDGSLVGRELAALFRGNSLVLKRVADALSQASQAGAAAETWATMREFLPTVLTGSKPATGLPDLLLVAESAAAAARATDDIPELTGVASRPGRSRLITEAARLSRTLTENRARPE
ncbi:hypothetical protein Ait01nite_088890 [Actinoplanes italicus]|uniref:DUF7825 domain-containing protein n=1 Tax=Actinoplanes italicus TaxID=113567 RepID=A0A2T0JWQ3_9ACTN|nr:DUF6493 family protein [Actinoplanes italicus]PRX12209.1 hypothetical protein CLV67_12966 [Actinoplanes italicus]GIE35844.1 hypothetical protein Ait01nite_088890 [Actinoplanes italicus]